MYWMYKLHELPQLERWSTSCGVSCIGRGGVMQLAVDWIMHAASVHKEKRNEFLCFYAYHARTHPQSVSTITFWKNYNLRLNKNHKSIIDMLNIITRIEWKTAMHSGITLRTKLRSNKYFRLRSETLTDVPLIHITIRKYSCVLGVLVRSFGNIKRVTPCH